MSDYDDDEVGYEECGDEQVGFTGAGTILRPLYPEYQERPSFMPPLGMKAKFPHWDPSVRWGDKVKIDLPVSGAIDILTKDLLNTTLRAPTTCQIQFHAEVLNPSVISTEIQLTTVDLYIGNGSTLTHVRKCFSWLPQVGNNRHVMIDCTWTIPLTNIRGRVGVFGTGGTPTTRAAVELSLWLCPLVNQEQPVAVKVA